MRKYLYLMFISSFIGIFFVLFLQRNTVAKNILYFCNSKTTNRLMACFMHANRQQIMYACKITKKA